jgi:hypothetical protein
MKRSTKKMNRNEKEHKKKNRNKRAQKRNEWKYKGAQKK